MHRWILSKCNVLVDVDECAENIHDCDKDSRAHCLDVDGGYTCQCVPELYSGDGHLCTGN